MVPLVYGAHIAASVQVSLCHSGPQTPDRFAVTLHAGGHTRIARNRKPCARTGWRNHLGGPDACVAPVDPDGTYLGSATRRAWARDWWIGWSADVPAANFGTPIRRHRSLRVPGVRIHHNDWQASDPVYPAMDLLHVSPETCGYRHHHAGRAVARQTSVGGGAAFHDGSGDDSRSWIAGLDRIRKRASVCPDTRAVATHPFPSIPYRRCAR